MAEHLGYDLDIPQHRQMIEDRLGDTMQDILAGGHSSPMMTVRQFLQQQSPDLDIDAAVTSLGKQRGQDRETEKRIKTIFNTFGFKADERNRQLGLEYIPAYSRDTRHTEMTKNRSSFGNAKKKTAKQKDDLHNAERILDSILIGDPGVEAPAQLTETKRGFAEVPVGAFGPDTHSVKSIYNSAGHRHEFGDTFRPNFDYRINKDGSVAVRIIPQGHDQHLVQPLESFWRAVAPAEWMNMMRSGDDHHVNSRAMLNQQERMAAQFKVNSIGQTRHSDPRSLTRSEVGLASLTNPDILRKELGSAVPLLQPMHRIFDLKDLEHLRGFTGDWIVSNMPEGERGFVEKDGDKVKSETFDLSDEDKENFAKVSKHDYHADVIKTEEGYYIFDVIKFDDKEVHEIPIDDRIKFLRGAMEGIANIHTPSASDTRLTDDAGLKAAVESLQEEHQNILLRDAKSVYMAGELRHPKWVMLRPGQDVVLRVLERRGNGPYTYRLGTGPITQDQHLGDRAVESDGDVYMDVGAAFNSSEKYNEGDHVRVNVANVTKVEGVDDNDIYTVSGSEIQGEAEGEGLVSRETLGLLTKSTDMQWLCELERAPSGVRVMMPLGDVVYKCTQSGPTWTVHSPLADNNYLIRLAESQRPYWSPVAGAMLKADLEIKEEVHESKGDGKPLIDPKRMKNTNWWDKRTKVLVKGLEIVDRFLKSSIGAVGAANASAKGLAIDYATPIESPMGPTNLHDEKTMPDFDNRSRPGEDFTIPEEEEEEEVPNRRTIPTKEGVLEITEDKAVFRM